MTRKNSRNGYHFNHKYWQDYKKQIPPITGQLWQVATAMSLSDASVYKVSREAYIKFEQGYKQKEFLYHLFHLFKGYCFMEEPGLRYELRGTRVGKIKSYWFKTFSHNGFTPLWHLLYINGRKSIEEQFLLQQLTPCSLAYWIMSDGSLHHGGKTMLLHTQSFNWEENKIICGVLQKKFKLNCKVIPHKTKYSVVEISGKSAPLLRKLLIPFLIPSMMYKLPRE